MWELERRWSGEEQREQFESYFKMRRVMELRAELWITLYIVNIVNILYLFYLNFTNIYFFSHFLCNIIIPS